MAKITYLGQMCYLIETGGLRIVTDPYLSDSVDRPNSKRKYPPTATLAELMPDIILISHPHRDHLDPKSLEPFYRLRIISYTLVPAPSAEIIRSLGGNAVEMRAPAPAVFGEKFILGGVKIAALPCAHTELHRDKNGDYIELSYLIEADGLKVFFGGDMSIYDGLPEALAEVKPDFMLLPANGRDWFRTSRGIIGNLDSNEAAELSVLCGTRMYIPGHHDLYNINGCPNDWIRYSAEKFGAPLKLLNPGESTEI